MGWDSDGAALCRERSSRHRRRRRKVRKVRKVRECGSRGREKKGAGRRLGEAIGGTDVVMAASAVAVGAESAAAIVIRNSCRGKRSRHRKRVESAARVEAAEDEELPRQYSNQRPPNR